MNRPSNDANGFAYKHTDQLLLFHVLQFLQSVVENGARLANQDRREDFRQVGQRHAALGALGDPVINTKLSILLFFVVTTSVMPASRDAREFFPQRLGPP